MNLKEKKHSQGANRGTIEPRGSKPALLNSLLSL